MPSPEPRIRLISKCMVPPHPPPAIPADHRCHLNHWDLPMLSAHYIQKGLLFAGLPPTLSIHDMADRLKTSLAATLHHFYPLAGRLIPERELDGENNATGVYFSIQCSNEGAEFVHAAAKQIKVADVLSPSSDVPAIVRSFFLLDGAVSYDGRTLPLLAVQMTELDGGVFVGCSFNHVVGDGTSYWSFFNAWAEISRGGGDATMLTRLPVHDRWFIDGAKPPIKLPFTHEDEFIERYCPPPLREKMFHFSSHSIAKVKARANEECGTSDISSFQSLSSLLWRCITRVRGLPPDQETCCRVAIQNRGRLRPSQSPDYFGNSIYSLRITATAGELAANGLGWAARAIHNGVVAHTDEAIKGMVREWMEKPTVYRPSMFEGFNVVIGSSPRFNMYGCEFGWGKAVALRSGSANKCDGKVSCYPGWEGGGSVDLELCLAPETMSELESDPEFAAAVYAPVPLHLQLGKGK